MAAIKMESYGVALADAEAALECVVVSLGPDWPIDACMMYHSFHSRCRRTRTHPTRRLDPHYVKALYRRGSAHYALGKYKEALKDFRQVVKVRLFWVTVEAFVGMFVCGVYCHCCAWVWAIVANGMAKVASRVDM